MKQKYKLSIILPVYNEEESLSIMINILEATLDFPHEVFIVYDDINDRSIEPAKRLKKLYSNIFLIHNDLGKGVQNAITKGVEFCTSDIILIAVVDEVLPIIAIKDMMTLINEKNCDFVSATRYSYGGRRYGGSLIGGILSRIANKSFRLITGMILSDSTTGMKMMRKSAWKKINIESKPIGWAFAFEISLKAQLLGLKLGEIPVKGVDRLFGGRSTFKPGLWAKEYFRWYIWGLKKLNWLNRKQKKIVTLDKYLNEKSF